MCSSDLPLSAHEYASYKLCSIKEAPRPSPYQLSQVQLPADGGGAETRVWAGEAEDVDAERAGAGCSLGNECGPTNDSAL